MEDKKMEEVKDQEKVEEQSQPAKEFSWQVIKVTNEGKPIPSRYHSSVYYNGKIYTFGGVKASKTASNDFFVFDIKEKTWIDGSKEGDFPSPRGGHSCVIYKTKMYIFGGVCQKISLNDFFSYDFETGKWEKITQKTEVWPSEREHHSCIIFQNKMVLFGGSHGNKKYKKELFFYDFEENTWTQIETSEVGPEGRAGHLCFLKDSNMIIFGGYCGEGGFTYLGDTWSLSLESPVKTWSPTEMKGLAPGTARQISWATFHDKETNSDKLYVFGGYAGDHPTATLRIFDVQNFAWEFAEMWMAFDGSDMGSQLSGGSNRMKPFARYGHSTIVDEDENIYVISGAGSTYLTDIVVISPLE